jgi:apolipoprotein N-acyltransferase
LSSSATVLLSAARAEAASQRVGVAFGTAVAACTVSALLYGALFPPLDLGWLGMVAFAPYLWAISSLSPSRAAVCGVVWAVVATTGTAWWLPQMLGGYFGLGTLGAWLGLAGVGLFTVGPWQAAFAAWLAWRARRGAVSPFAIGAAWALTEFARAHAPIPNPVGLFAYSQVGNPIAQIADLAGPYGIAALFVATSAALVNALRTRLATPRARRSFVAVAAVLAAAVVYGEWRLTQRFDEGPPVRVAVVQGAVVRAVHWDRSTRPANLERYLSLTRSVAAAHPDLVFWPEFAVDFYLNEPTPHREKLRADLQVMGVELVTGASRFEFGDDRTHYYNSVFVVDASGRATDAYDKNRLMPFAEYSPFGDWLRGDQAIYDSGWELQPLTTSAGRVGAFICGEALFPEVARTLAAGGAEVLANPSNDYWFGDPAGAKQHLQAAVLRAVENRRWVIRPTSTGYSAVIDPGGRVVARTEFGVAATLEATVFRSSQVTPYQRLGDAPIGAALALVVWSSARSRSVRADGAGASESLRSS